MKNFILKVLCLTILFSLSVFPVFSKGRVSMMYSKQTSSEKVFKIYFNNIVIDDAETARITNAYLEKMYIKTCTKSSSDGFVVFTIKTEDLIDKTIIYTVLKRLGYSFDKEGKISLIQE